MSYPVEMLERMRERELKGDLAKALKNYWGNPSTSAAHYKLTDAWLLEQLRRQGVVCALCHSGLADRHWVIDHCHSTNKVRGCLCLSCNVWLGKNEGIVERTWRYLNGQV